MKSVNISLRNRRILVVDDHAAIHEDFAKILAPQVIGRERLDALEANLFNNGVQRLASGEFELSSAFQGLDAVEMVKAAVAARRPYAMVFLDVRMPPGLDGVETAELLWRADPDLQIVICSAYTDYSWEEMTLKLGHSGHLVILKKPFENIEVLQMATAMTEKWWQTQQARLKFEQVERMVEERTAALNNTMDELRKSLVEGERSAAALRESEAQVHQMQKMESIGQLAGGVAHDFNNILTVINGHAAMLLDDRQTPRSMQEAVKRILVAGERAAGLTRQLLSFSRKQVVQNQVFNLNEAIRELSKMLHRLIGEDVMLQMNLDAASAMILADPGMMGQIVMNLVVNARDAMPRGGVLAIETANVAVDGNHVRRQPRARMGDFLCLSVRDTGEGIAPEVLPRIFEPFFTTKEPGKGTGLGLATVFGIVEQHQGWLEVDTRPGAGTCFKIFLPLAGAPETTGKVTHESMEIVGGCETILLVEDEISLRTMTSVFLEKYGYKVLPASRGTEAMQIWRSYGQRIDVLLTDVVMPGGMTGLELATEMQACDPLLKVILTSGYALEKAGEGFSLRHDLRFLQKPYTLHALSRCLRECLEPERPGRLAISA